MFRLCMFRQVAYHLQFPVSVLVATAICTGQDILHKGVMIGLDAN